jgi:hypothetical protein
MPKEQGKQCDPYFQSEILPMHKFPILEIYKHERIRRTAVKGN